MENQSLIYNPSFRKLIFSQHHFFHLTLTFDQLFEWPVVVDPVPEHDFFFLIICFYYQFLKNLTLTFDLPVVRGACSCWPCPTAWSRPSVHWCTWPCGRAGWHCPSSPGRWSAWWQRGAACHRDHWSVCPLSARQASVASSQAHCQTVQIHEWFKHKIRGSIMYIWKTHWRVKA